MSLTLQHSDAVEKIAFWLEAFDLTLSKKILTRDEVLHLELNYEASFVVHHVFLKRILSLDGVGHITVI